MSQPTTPITATAVGDEDETTNNQQQYQEDFVTPRQTPPRAAKKKQVLYSISKWFKPRSATVHRLLNEAQMRKESEESLARVTAEKKRRADIIESMQSEDRVNKRLSTQQAEVLVEDDPILAATEYIKKISSVREPEDEEENSILPLYVPAKCTDLLQECDLVLNKPFKVALKAAFRDLSDAPTVPR